MNQIYVTTLFNIPPDHLDEFKALARQALALTKDDPGTPHYDWYFSSDETQWAVRETYVDAQGMLAHLQALGELIGRFGELSNTLDAQIFGLAPPEFLEAAAPSVPMVYHWFQGK